MRHEYGAGADGAVKHLHKPLLGADIQIAQRIEPCGFYVCNLVSAEQGVCVGRDLHFHIRLLVRAVCIEERSGEIYDLFSSPDQDKSRFFRDNGNLRRLQIFLCGVSHELIHILRIYNNRHALLGFGDGDLRPVKTGIFLRNFIQFNAKTVRQLADGYGHAARAEVVALLDEAAYFLAAEQTLDLALCRRIPFLYFRAACLD